MDNQMSIAILIDGENISPKYVEAIIEEALNYGRINHKRVYGDWSKKIMTNWKKQCLEYGLSQVQQFSYTNKKNVSDFSLVIDAMDIMYGGKVDCFCIISSDSDFTKLVTRIKENNILVYGMGETKTPIALVNSCEKFTYLDKIVESTDTNGKTDKEKKKVVSSITPKAAIINYISQMISNEKDDDDWSYWGVVAEKVKKKFPGFHPRNYGHELKLDKFLEKTGSFEFKTEKSSRYVRNTKKK